MATRYCSLIMTVIMLSSCGNFVGSLGERMNSNPEAAEHKQAESAKQRPDLK